MTQRDRHARGRAERRFNRRTRWVEGCTTAQPTGPLGPVSCGARTWGTVTLFDPGTASLIELDEFEAWEHLVEHPQVVGLAGGRLNRPNGLLLALLAEMRVDSVLARRVDDPNGTTGELIEAQDRLAKVRNALVRAEYLELGLLA